MKERTFLKSTLGKCTLGAGLILSLMGISFATTGGSADPLVTLSYLQQTILPALTAEGKSYGISYSAEMEANLDSAIAEFREELANTSTQSTSPFQVVQLNAGEGLTLSQGAQLVLRSGTLSFTGSLQDLTEGTTIDSTSFLTQNHLYLATDGEIPIAAAEASVTLMISGSYRLH